ncbi:hypothetical protein [Intrasporangium sp. DVR]|uniref:hypothetical protein n=1 Tax=Intrasporangium sp. DVR TaxID=3127867 RepID=UPI00313A6100
MVTGAFLALGGWHQSVLPGDDARSTGWLPLQVVDRYFGVVSNWDGRWYRSIAEGGYPETLPRSPNGTVQENAWAFWPLYPAIVRLVMQTSTISFEASAWLVSVTCAALAMVVLYRLVLPTLGQWGAAAVVACVMSFPSSPILQIAYPEGLALLLVVLALQALRDHRYGLVCLFALALGLTRPVSIPLAVVGLIHGFSRWRRAGRGEEAFTSRELWVVLLTSATCIAAFALWPLTADLVVGERNVYLKTLSAWSVNNQDSAGVLGGWVHDIMRLTPLGWVAIAAMLWVLYLVLRNGSDRWPLEIRGWGIAYTTYILVATRPSPSVLRYLLLAVIVAVPFPEVLSGIRGGKARLHAFVFVAAIVGFGLLAQYLWVANVLTIRGSPLDQTYP